VKILVTGHLGFIGPVVLRMLHEKGHETVGMDVGYFRENAKPWENSVKPHTEVISDIREYPKNIFDGVDGIIHLCAISNDPMGQLNPGVTNKINFEASIAFAEEARAKGVSRFVFASSCSIYGNAGWSEKPLDETASFNPVSAYAVSKVNMEAGLISLATDNFSPTFMRNATAYGVSDRTRLDLVVANLIAYGLVTKKVKVMSDGTPWRPLTHIEDIAMGAVCAIEADREVVHNQAFNIGRSDANYRVIDIANKISAALGGLEVEVLGVDTNDTRSYQVDFSKALNTLPGFKPEWDLERGIQQILDWFHGREITEDIIQSRDFIRINQLQYLQNAGKLNQELELRS